MVQAKMLSILLSWIHSQSTRIRPFPISKSLTVSRHLPLTTTRGYRSTSICRLNRFLFDPEEVQIDQDGRQIAILNKDDYRTIHAAKILDLHNGDTLRAGIIGERESGLITDQATIQWIPQGKVKKAEPLGNGNPPGDLKVRLDALQPPSTFLPSPPVSLILALPRPLQLGRVLPMISQMGVETLVLTGAAKVPKDYFGSHLFRQPMALRERLTEGLCQAGDVQLPRVIITQSLRSLWDQMDDLFPVSEYARAVAHPLRADTVARRLGDILEDRHHRKIVVAVGPEGGWMEPDELDLFRSQGFEQVTMGARTLRSDCAVVSLLALAHDACQGRHL